MKIDLHVHTIKVKNKDTGNRDIKCDMFCDIMARANVGIVAITNHNYFDNDQYEKIIDESKNKQLTLMVIPGIEIDILLNENRKQMNVLFPSEKIEDFKNFYNNFLIDFTKINNNELNGIKIEDFKKYIIEKCASINIILYIDNKNISYKNNKNKTSFSDEDIDSYLSELDKENNICIIRDTNDYKKFTFLIKNKKKCLIGSDNLDWDNYIENSKNLLEYNKLISNFDDLFYIFKKGESYETFEKMKLCENISSLNLDKNINVYNLKIIKKTINVIFGPKASGKTKLLKCICEKLCNNLDKNYYETSDEQKFLSKYNEKDYLNNVKDQYTEEFKKIIEHEEIINVLPNLYNWAKQKNNFYFKLENVSINEDMSVNTDIENVKNYIKNLKKSLVILGNISTKTADFSDDLKLIEEMINNTVKKWLLIKKKEIDYKVDIKTQNVLKNITKDWRNKMSPPTKIGLYENAQKRIMLLNSLNKIKKIINSEQIVNLYKYEIPTENSENKFIDLKYKLLFKINEKPNSNYSTNLNKLLEMYCIKHKLIDPFKYINELKDIIKEKGNDIHFIGKDNYIFTQNNQKIDLSKGEIQYLNLVNFLERELDYYFLDEPESSLNNNFISKSLYKKIVDLVRVKNKTIIMTTHNSILGINTDPMNFIFRDNKSNDEYGNFETLIGNIQEHYLIDTRTEKKTNIKISNKLLEYFEGDLNKYNYRKKVYEVK